MNQSSRALVERLEVRQLFTVFVVDPQGELVPGAQVLTSFAQVETTNLEPGDQLLFRADRTLEGTVKLTAEDAGAPGNPVLISSYNGTATITRTVTTPGTPVHGLVVENAGWVEVSNLRFEGVNQGPVSAAAVPTPSNGIWFTNTSTVASKLEHVVIDDVEVTGFGKYGILIGNSDYVRVGTGRKAQDVAVKRGFNDVQILNSTASGNYLGGIASLGAFSAAATTFAHSNVTVSGCVASDNSGYLAATSHSGDGIVMADIDVVNIDHCVAYNNGFMHGSTGGGPVGVWVWDVNAATIEYNESYDNRTAVGGKDGGGFDLDGGVTNSVVQYNYSHGNDGAGYGIYQFGGARPKFEKNVIRYNISHNDGRKNGYAGIDFWNGNGSNGIRDIEVYNNTVVMSSVPGGPQPFAIRFLSATTNVHVRNNIFRVVGTPATSDIDPMVGDVPAKHTGLLFQGNSYTTVNAAFKFRLFAKTHTSLTSLRAAGLEAVGNVATGSGENPNLSPVLDDVNFMPSPLGIDAVKSPSGFQALGALYRPTAKPPTTAGTPTSTPFANGGAINLWNTFKLWDTLDFDTGRRDILGTALPASKSAAQLFSYDVGAAQYVAPTA